MKQKFFINHQYSSDAFNERSFVNTDQSHLKLEQNCFGIWGSPQGGAKRMLRENKEIYQSSKDFDILESPQGGVGRMLRENKEIYQSSKDFDIDKKVQFLILHCTKQDFATSLHLLQDKVSAHYLISESAEIFQLVDESKRAWHAGVSFWKGQNDLNSASIGIEIVNLDGNRNHYPDEQIEALIFLCKKIIAKYKITPECVLAHSDIAPLRKDDPGILFPWNKLYQNGIGLMVNLADILELKKTIKLPTALELQQNLAKYGYQIDLTGEFDQQTIGVLNSFRRHFCPNFLEQKIEKTSYAILLKLIEMRSYAKSHFGERGL